MPKRPLVLDTNVVLDAFVFLDASAQPVLRALEERQLSWLATQAMRDEFERVLGYANIEPWLASRELAKRDVLASFDRHASLVETPCRAAVDCADPDDQMFIDLAVARRGLLLSKDRAVLRLKRRLAQLDVLTGALLPVQDQIAPLL